MASLDDFARELFTGVGPVQVKRMFGGAGAFVEGVMFALIGDDAIYIKADEALQQRLREEGSGPFTWTRSKGPRAGETMEMSYWRLPDAALDDPELASDWGLKALAVARAKAKPTRTRATKARSANGKSKAPPKRA